MMILPPLLRMNKRTLLARCATLLACAAVAAGAVAVTAGAADEYVTASPAVTQRFGGISDEAMLLDFCARLETVRGVTGVRYRDYDPTQRAATLMVYYNPRMATPRQIKIFLDHSAILWVPARSI